MTPGHEIGRRHGAEYLLQHEGFMATLRLIFPLLSLTAACRMQRSLIAFRSGFTDTVQVLVADPNGGTQSYNFRQTASPVQCSSANAIPYPLM